MPHYSVTGIYHHPDGVELPGTVLNLTEEQAEHGLESGSLVLAQVVMDGSNLRIPPPAPPNAPTQNEE